MGLDVYAGPLTRYYSGEWETVIERYAREHGKEIRIVRAGATEEETERPSLEQVHELVSIWRMKIGEQLEEYLDAPFFWEDTAELPYETDKPSWENYGALLLWAAHHEHPDEPLEPGPVKEWARDSAFLASLDEDFASIFPNLLYNVELWLPVPFAFTFKAIDPSGRPVQMGSSVELFNELQRLNNETWQADYDTRMDWRGGCPATGCDVEEGARFGFAIMYDLALYSVQRQVPLKLDY